MTTTSDRTADLTHSVLLVEDSPGDAHLVTRMLRQTSFGEFDVATVATLADAVAALRAGPRGCVLLDLDLPDADALGGLLALRAAFPGLPVVVLTGAERSVAYAALNAGAQDYLVKGEIDGELLARAVRYAVERARADAALVARERELVESHRLARMGTWEWRADDDVVVASAELYDALGMPRQAAAMSGADAIALVAAEDRARVRGVVTRLVREGGREAFEARLTTPRGVRATRHVAEARRGRDGRVTALFGTMQDVTVVQQAEAAQRASERRYRTIVETAQEGVWTLDDEGVTTFANRRMAGLLGYRPEEMAGRHLRAFADGKTWAAMAATLARSRRGEPAQRDVRLRRRDGSSLHAIASISPLWSDEGVYEGALVMVTDITARHAAEQRLLLDHDVAVGLSAASGLDDGVTTVIERAAAAVGSPYVEVWHRPPGERLLAQSSVHHVADPRYEPLRHASATVRLVPGDDVVGEAWAARTPKSGAWSYDVARAGTAAACGLRGAYVMPIVASESVVAVVVWHLPEERPSPLAAALLENIGTRLDEFAVRWQVAQMKDVFLSAVSHELRTPLTVLIGHAGTLQRHARQLADEERALCVAGIVRNAAKLNVMLADLLDVDRLARGVLEPRRHVVRLDDLVRAVVTGFDADAGRMSLELAECVAHVDPPKVERLVENLVANAVKYAPAGSPIDVRLAAGADAAVICVDDRGPGVPDELKSAVFEPFRRGEHVQTHAPGTGVGLSLVAGFARLHGGHAWVEDRPGGGASFRVALPLTPQPGAPAPAQLPEPRASRESVGEVRSAAP